MVHNLFFGYCLCSLHCCCLGNIKSDDKKKPVLHVLTYIKSPYTDTWVLLIAHGNSVFGCSCNLLYVKHYTRFLYKCTVSVIVRSLHMKEKKPAQTLSKVYAFKFIYINWRYIHYYLYILHMPRICLVKNCLWFKNF